MNEGLIPHRYAKALLKVAQEKKQDKVLYDAFQTLDRSFTEQPALSKTLANPFVDDDRKKQLIVTAASLPDNSLLDDFIKLLVKNRRIDLIREIGLDYLKQYRQANLIYLVTISSAAPMDESEVSRLKALVQKQLPKGATIQLSEVVDPSLIGGFSIAIDNTLLDASVKNQLKLLRSNLISQ